ncbi:MAG: hypothetical protein N2257_07925 [Thermodesulfovibrionales bacterium]|nr:hypothetical protein [Thermodesulfovibrionales bacterium]
MKFKRLLISFMVMNLFFLLYVNLILGHRNSAPTMECLTCHEGEIISDMVKIEGVPISYVPNKTYTMTVTINSDLESISDSRGGFSLEVSAGKLIIKDKKNTQLINGFLTHTQEGSELRKWNFQWRAPSRKDEVTITVMAVASNGDYSPAGDRTGAASYIIKPSK